MQRDIFDNLYLAFLLWHYFALARLVKGARLSGQLMAVPAQWDSLPNVWYGNVQWDT